MLLPSGALCPRAERLAGGRPKLGALIFPPVMAPIELCRKEGDGSPIGVNEGAEEGGGPAGVVEG
jgi:hypothetical protein